jgi:hypothetical protein
MVSQCTFAIALTEIKRPASPSQRGRASSVWRESSRCQLCAAVLLIIVMTVVFPVPPVPMIAPIVGTLIPHTGFASYHRRSRHDHWRRLDNHWRRSRYNHWCRGDHDWNRQSQPNRDMEPSRVRGQGQEKACDTQKHHQTKHPWECAYAFHCSNLLCFW